MKIIPRNIVLPITAASLVFSTLWLTCQKRGNHPETKTDYVASISPQEGKIVLLEGEEGEILLTLENQGRSTWSPEGKYPVILSCELTDHQGNVQKRNRNQFSIPRRLRPRDSLVMAVPITAPLKKGEYVLDFKLFRKDMAWFAQRQPEKSKVALLVKERRWTGTPRAIDLDYGRYTKFECSEDVFTEAFKLILLTLKHNEVHFQGKTGEIFGFYAGSGYPQIWLRDANSLLPLLPYFYDKPALSSWLEEHLAHQMENGSLQDTVDEAGRTEKNTTETDQESSAVQAAYRVYQILGPAWLRRSVQGEKIIDRLERSLLYPLSQRYDPGYKLLTGAHTADWGDVDAVDSDRSAVVVDERTHWTADIYDQSMFYQACRQLGEMYEAVGEVSKAESWNARAGSIRENAQRWLWQEDKGFFRIHVHVQDWSHDFDEDDIFPMGGNAQAILSGLADETQSRRIIEEAVKRQKTLGVSTISGTLLPPFPAKFFRHPMLDEPYEYQNGAQWDWFGGRLITAMFESGFALTAKNKLAEITSKNIANAGFFEWDSKDGIGQGSNYFLGSAGSIGQAFFEGYFGIRLGKDFLALEPKLGQDSGRIHVYQPATDIFAAYDYAFDARKKRLRLKYNSNFPGRGLIKIWSVWPVTEKDGKLRNEAIDVFVDKEKIEFQVEEKNSDVFIVIPTDFRNRTLRIVPKK